MKMLELQAAVDALANAARSAHHIMMCALVIPL